MTPADLPPRIRRRVVVVPTGCWIWTGSQDRGYGKVKWFGATMRLHRLVYTLFVGDIPAGMQADHRCRVELCCNPHHIDIVTNRENALRIPYQNVGQQRAAQVMRSRTHCPRNHPYDEKNTGINKKGGRICRACARDKMRLARAARREAQKRREPVAA